MANKALFPSAARVAPSTDTINEAGGDAYLRDPKNALAQAVCAGSLGGTYYVNAEAELDAVLQLARDPNIPATFVGRLSAYARKEMGMKDTPALLLASLSVRDPAEFRRAFPSVCNTGRVLRTFVQIIRSGKVGRKSLGKAPREMIQRWLLGRRFDALVRDSVGNDPSLADVVRMVHPKPTSKEQAAAFAWLIGKAADGLPEPMASLERFRADQSGEVPDVHFMLLSALGLSKDQWRTVFVQASWMTTLMNLNTASRHGVYEDAATVAAIAARLAGEPNSVHPYRLYAAYKAAFENAPPAIRDVLMQAVNKAADHAPQLAGDVVVAVDVSGSMRNPITGQRGSATSAMSCSEVASLFAACVARRNPSARVWCFDTALYTKPGFNNYDSVFTIAQRIASFGGGGTAVQLPLEEIERARLTPDLVLIVSDNESWIGEGNPTAQAWCRIAGRVPKCRLVCLDLTPSRSVQVKSEPRVLNVGGFSERVWDVVADFAAGKMDGSRCWVDRIEKYQYRSVTDDEETS